MEEKKRTMGLPSAVATVVGLIVATSCLLSLGAGVGLAGNLLILSMAVVLVFNLLMVISFRELNWMMPNVEGGLGQYTKVGLGPVFSIISNLSTYLIAMVFAMVVEIGMCGMVVSDIFFPQVPPTVISIAIILALTLVNYLGIDVFKKVQNVVVSLLIISLFAMGILSSLKLGTGEVVEQGGTNVPPIVTIGGALALSAVAFWLFIGIEFVIPASQHVKNQKRNVGLSMVIGLIIIFAFNAILANGMGNYVPYEVLASSDLPHMDFAEALYGQAGIFWMGLVTILASISSANTVFMAVPPILSGMAKNDMMPAAFDRKNRFGVPVLGLFVLIIIVIAIVASGFALSSGLLNILLAATCFWITTYILIAITTIALRRRYPKHPGRTDSLRWFNIPQYVSIAIGLYMIWNIAEGDARILIFKIFGILGAALVAYAVIWVGGVKKQPLFKGDSIDDVMFSENLARMEEEKRSAKA
ncbi:MAG: APC family permease [Clostridiales Family XIII bacterium]|jgi:amino acid transporter|nr:APC family permease [Clostridiales Family XIII bacterium]